MRRILLLVSLVACLALPMSALGEGAPSPAAVVAACQAEAAHLGKDAFVAKYGPTEPFGHCIAQHAGVTTTSTTTTTQAPPPPKPNAGQVQKAIEAFCKDGGRGKKDCVEKARALVAPCLASTSRDALKACIASALGASKRR